MDAALPQGTLEIRPTFDPGMFPAKRRPWYQFLLDHNPCLLVSTVCMLLGCFLVNSELKEQDAVFKLMGLLGVSRPESVPNLTRRFGTWLASDPRVREHFSRLEEELDRHGLPEKT